MTKYAKYVLPWLRYASATSIKDHHNDRMTTETEWQIMLFDYNNNNKKLAERFTFQWVLHKKIY